MHRLASTLVFAFMVTACDRGPEPTSGGQPLESSPAEARNEPLPPNHPPTGEPNLPSDHPPTGGEGTPRGPADPEAGGLRWEVPDPFEAKPVSGSMRAAEYEVPSEEQGAPPTSLAVFYFGPGQGGSTQANVDRWVGQFDTPDGQGPEIEKREDGDLAVTVVDVSGTHRPMQMPGQDEGSEPRPDHRMLGAIVEGPEGPVFFKLVGPKQTVDRAEDAFGQLIESVQEA
ncbi:MAG: hypothetical protein ACOCXM_08700 [Myxococcota bacterium]